MSSTSRKKRKAKHLAEARKQVIVSKLLGNRSCAGCQYLYLKDIGYSNYTVTDTTTGSVVGSYTYSAGSSITSIAGVTFTLQGTPAAGDSFAIARASRAVVVSGFSISTGLPAAITRSACPA